MSFWPSLRLDTITMAVMTGRRSRPGFTLTRRAIPADLVVRRAHLTYTSPALTALDLVDSCGGDGIDQALRVRATTLPRLHDALTLTTYRPGNGDRRRIVLESRDHPWSRAEREGHALLHRAGITGWQGNLWVDLPEGGGCFLDVGFEKQKVAIEIDGWEYHGKYKEDFEKTWRRHNALVAAGWRVLHFTWQQLTTEPEWVIERIREVLAAVSP